MSLRRATNSYATDGKCHNAEPGSFNHECGKPATWLGRKKAKDGGEFVSGFCDGCKERGYEARPVTEWERITAWSPGMPRKGRGYHHRHAYPLKTAEYAIAMAGFALFWVIVVGDVLFNWLAYAGLPEWLTR